MPDQFGIQIVFQPVDKPCQSSVEMCARPGRSQVNTAQTDTTRVER